MRPLYSFFQVQAEKPASMFRVVAAALVANVVMNLALVPQWGARGAAVAASLAGIVAVGVAYRASRPRRTCASPSSGRGAATSWTTCGWRARCCGAGRRAPDGGAEHRAPRPRDGRRRHGPGAGYRGHPERLLRLRRRLGPLLAPRPCLACRGSTSGSASRSWCGRYSSSRAPSRGRRSSSRRPTPRCCSPRATASGSPRACG